MDHYHQNKPGRSRSIVARCLLALAVPFALLALFSGGCAVQELGNAVGDRESFVFWGALKVLFVSGSIAAVLLTAWLYMRMPG